MVMKLNPFKKKEVNIVNAKLGHVLEGITQAIG